MEKKDIFFVLLLLVLVIACIFGYIRVFKPSFQFESEEVLSVSLNEFFTLHKNQSARVDDINLEIEIIDLINSPCTEDNQCIWSGTGIAFEFRYNDDRRRELDLTEAFGYKLTVIDTDYSTYAKLKISEVEM